MHFEWKLNSPDSVIPNVMRMPSGLDGGFAEGAWWSAFWYGVLVPRRS
jgi:hypothetical protein